MAGLMKAACVVVVCMAVLGAPMAEAITCGQVNSNLASCLGYLQKGGAPPPACCNGVRGLAGAAKTTADRRAVCNCLKSSIGSLGGAVLNNAAALPGRCGVSIPYKISPSTNCATIKF